MGAANLDLLAATTRVCPSGRKSLTSRLLGFTLLDFFFVAVIAWSFMTSGTGWARLLWDGDTALHTAIGNWVIDHGRVPDHDPFSYTMPDAPWLAVEWGTGAIFALLHQVAGLKGIVFVCGVTIALTVTLLVRLALAAGAGTFVSVALALLANNALLMHYHARPHIFTLLFFTLAVWAATVDRRQRTCWIWTLPLLTIPWANLHPGFVILIAYLLLIASGDALRWALNRGDTAALVSARRYTFVAGLCALASLVNPFGYRLHVEIASYFGATGMTDLIQEFQAPTFRSAPQLTFLLFLMAGMALAGRLLERRKFADAIVLLALAYASLTSVRHATIFVIAAVPIVGREWSALFSGFPARAGRGSVVEILSQISLERRGAFASFSLLPVFALAAILFLTPESQWPSSFDRSLFPVTVATRNSDRLAAGRTFAPEQWSDYLLLANYPRQRVFFDDRSLYGESMFRQVAALMAGRPGSPAVLDQYRVDRALIPTQSSLAAVLGATSGWTEVDRDTTAVLFERTR
jgi:hypothetical protein